MILALKMKTEMFDSFLETRQPVWNWEILEYDWVEVSDKILNILFWDGVTTKNSMALTQHLKNVMHDEM